jgi:hypothetical protein
MIIGVNNQYFSGDTGEFRVEIIKPEDTNVI